MEKSRLPAQLVTIGVSFALGFGVAWFLRSPEPGTGLQSQTATAPAPGQAPGMYPFSEVGGKPGAAPVAPRSAIAENASVDQLWSMALAPQGSQLHSFDAEDRLRRMAQTNPVALRFLLQRYETDRSPQAREVVKSILSTVQTPEVISFAVKLASSSNAAERKYGFELVESLAPDSPEVRELIKRSLASEQSPEVLVQSLQALKPGMVEPDEANQIVTQLKTLAQHADPAVRRHSIMQIGQWDKKGESAEVLSQALTDRAAEVRQSAIFALAQSGTRSDAIKTALMALVTNPQETREIRGSALQALERFSLTKDEYASIARVKAQIQGL